MWFYRVIGVVMLMAFSAVRAAAQPRPPTIRHEPPAFAVRGQPLIVRALVTDTQKAIRAVRLFYAISRDAAPFEIPMEHSGDGHYIAVLPPHLFAGVEQFSYYIEATNAEEFAAETPWYTVRLRTLDASPTPQEATGRRPRWVAPAAIGGVALALAGAAIALANNDNGGSSPPADPSGTYSGPLELVVRDPGASPIVINREVILYIAPDGRVVSDTLHSGGTVSGQLTGASFSITAPVNEPGVTGQIVYTGTVSDQRIYGTVQGTRTTAAGEGTYSGYFTLQKR